ncbi:hypothetical protein C8J57DRAFT_1564179 [Mycena rebaudengoi]|nr:hypothetical protein C8J57DRAFT_1564179 [Mycena rebaudengoi]
MRCLCLRPHSAYAAAAAAASPCPHPRCAVGAAVWVGAGVSAAVADPDGGDPDAGGGGDADALPNNDAGPARALANDDAGPKLPMRATGVEEPPVRGPRRAIDSRSRWASASRCSRPRSHSHPPPLLPIRIIVVVALTILTRRRLLFPALRTPFRAPPPPATIPLPSLEGTRTALPATPFAFSPRPPRRGSE